jgi:hypothetical protein
VERDPKRPGRLLFRYEKEIVGTLDIAGPGRSVEDLLVRDRTQLQPDITGLDIEVLHPPGATVTFQLRRASFAKVGNPYGLQDMTVRKVPAKPPYRRDELQLWPPVGDLGPIQRHDVTEDERAEREQQRRDLVRELGELRKEERRLRWKLEYLKDVEEQSQLAEAEVHLYEADRAIRDGDPAWARRRLRLADRAIRTASDKLYEALKGRVESLTLLHSVLSKVAVVGEVTANLIPGPVGRFLSGLYEVAKGPPKTVEEAAERMRGAKGGPPSPRVPPGGKQRPGQSGQPTPGSLGAARRHEYDGPGAGKAPKHGQDALDQSLQISDKSSGRVGVDYKAGQFVIFDEHSPGRFRGEVREWKKLGPDAQKMLIEWGMASERGRILIGGIYERNPQASGVDGRRPHRCARQQGAEERPEGAGGVRPDQSHVIAPRRRRCGGEGVRHLRRARARQVPRPRPHMGRARDRRPERARQQRPDESAREDPLRR